MNRFSGRSALPHHSVNPLMLVAYFQKPNHSKEKTLMSEIDFAIMPESYETLAVENVQSNKQLLRDLWKAAAPDVDMDHGALDALVLNPAATMLEAARATFRTARNSSSFTALLADTSDVQDKMLDELAASYRVNRRKGTAASGRIRLFFQEDIYRVVGLSSTFQGNGVLFNLRNIETIQHNKVANLE